MTNKTTPTSSIKVKFNGVYRAIDLSSPVTLAGLQAAVAAAFAVDLPARLGTGDIESDLLFTYNDPDGDDILFDQDSELSLALSRCPNSLEVFATRKENGSAKPDSSTELYHHAARTLREYYGVPSMTPAKLMRTLVFLELTPDHLVRQGLAPRVLLARVKLAKKKGVTHPLRNDDNNEGLVEAVGASVEPMGVDEDGKKENVEPCGLGSKTGAKDVPSSAAAAPVAEKDVLHQAFAEGGIQLCPSEVRPLLIALGVRRRLLVKLGQIEGKHLRAVVEAKRTAAREHDGAPNDLGSHPECMVRHGPVMMVSRRLCTKPVTRRHVRPCGGLEEEHGKAGCPAAARAAGSGRPGGRADAPHPSGLRRSHFHSHSHPPSRGLGFTLGGGVPRTRIGLSQGAMRTSLCRGGEGGGDLQQQQHYRPYGWWSA